MLPYNQDTIVAIATPPGNGALAVVRISGSKLGSLYNNFTGKIPKNRFACFTKLYHPKTKNILDHSVVTYFKGPNSFTGEDVIEITCHGGETIKNSIVCAAIDAGVRQAGPGEFSFRSYLNGKMDLLQAEAISALISSKTELSAQISLQHLGGGVSSNISNIKSQITNVLAVIENELDFSENEITFTTYDELKSKILNVQLKIDEIIESSVFGKNIFSGIRIILYGKPNVGKSSLFNAILGHERAIISSSPGTTRDSVEAWFNLEGAPVCLVDTAGVWSAKTHVDILGVEKTKSELSRADLCVVVDDKDPTELIDDDFKKNYPHKYILVKSKIDLCSSFNIKRNGIIGTSSLKNTGINKLLTSVSTHVNKKINVSSETKHILITKRQRELLACSSKYLKEAVYQMDEGLETDIIASTLNGFVASIKDVMGEIPNKVVVQNIFNNFCVGK